MSQRILLFGDPATLRPVHRAAACTGATLLHETDASRLVPQSAAFQPQVACVELDAAGAIAPQLLRQVHQVCPDAALIVLSQTTTPKALEALFDEPWLTHLMALDSPWLVPDFTATLAKLQGADLFGLDRYLPWGTRLHSHRIGGSADKGIVFDGIESLMASMGIEGRVVHHLHAIADELLMNAIYDAPIDATGQPRYTDRARGEVVTLEAHERPTVRFGCDGRRFGISVTDPFGGLDPAVLRRYIGKGLRKAADQIDTKPGGAGLGLYVLFSSLHTLCLNLVPGRCTEVVGLIDVQGRFRHIAGGSRGLSIFVG
ncbi:MAG: ATP-binding protein [Bradymonadia bacterium]